MSEQSFAGGLEGEIAELNRQIEAKKRELETARGIVSDREVIHEVVAEHLYPTTTASTASDDQVAVTPAPAKTTKTAGQDYLDTLEPAEITILNQFIAGIPERGIRQTISLVQQQNSPFVIDAFHDLLVTRLYDELKSRGMIK